MDSNETSSALEPLFIPAEAPVGVLSDKALADVSPDDLRRAVNDLPFNTIYDYIRHPVQL